MNLSITHIPSSIQADGTPYHDGQWVYGGKIGASRHKSLVGLEGAVAAAGPFCPSAQI